MDCSGEPGLGGTGFPSDCAAVEPLHRQLSLSPYVYLVPTSPYPTPAQKIGPNSRMSGPSESISLSSQAVLYQQLGKLGNRRTVGLPAGWEPHAPGGFKGLTLGD